MYSSTQFHAKAKYLPGVGGNKQSMTTKTFCCLVTGIYIQMSLVVTVTSISSPCILFFLKTIHAHGLHYINW